jgi:hypothetical protein
MRRMQIAMIISAAALGLAGCGSTGDGQAGNPLGTTGASTPASTTPPTTAPPSTTAVQSGDDAGTTPTGTTLSLGQTAMVMYETTNAGTESTKLAVTAVSAKKGAISDLKNFNLDAQTKVSEPFYITVSFRNAGPKTMEPGGIFGLVKTLNTDGDELNRLSLIGDFKPCHGDTPKTLAVGASYTDCEVYVAPAGQNVGKVVFGFYLGSNRTEITWNAG